MGTASCFPKYNIHGNLHCAGRMNLEYSEIVYWGLVTWYSYCKKNLVMS